MMKFFTQRRKSYSEIELHSRKSFACVLDDAGQIMLYRNIPTEAKALRRALALQIQANHGNKEKNDKLDSRLRRNDARAPQ